MIKVVNVLNTFSAILFAIVLLTVYAYLPISIDLNIEGMSNMHKQDFFYNSIGIFVGINVLMRLVINIGFKHLANVLQAWFRLFIFIINVYFTLMIGFIGVWNNATSITPSTYSYLNYIGPFLLVVWIIGLIFLVIKKR